MNANPIGSFSVFGWREYRSAGLDDIDSTPLLSFHAYLLTDQEQISDELRYSGRHLRAGQVTTGLYYFQQDLLYLERRLVANGQDGRRRRRPLDLGRIRVGRLDVE